MSTEKKDRLEMLRKLHIRNNDTDGMCGRCGKVPINNAEDVLCGECQADIADHEKDLREGR